MDYETNTMNLIEKRELFDEYAKTLSEFDKTIADLSEEEMDEWFSRYFEPHEYWIDIISDNKVVGFLIVGERGGDCYPDADYTISQLYVSRNCRCEGLASKYVLEFLSDHSGSYALDILEGNKLADDFWKSIFKLLDVEFVSLGEVRSDPGPVNLIGFKC